MANNSCIVIELMYAVLSQTLFLFMYTLSAENHKGVLNHYSTMFYWESEGHYHH